MSQKKIILRSEDNENEPPNGLNVALSFKRNGIFNSTCSKNNSILTKLNLTKNEPSKAF